MKLAAVVALTLVGTLAFAQAAPHVPLPPPMSPPRSVLKAAPLGAPMSNEEVGNLLKAQTAAIQSLAERVELLNARLASVEGKVKR